MKVEKNIYADGLGAALAYDCIERKKRINPEDPEKFAEWLLEDGGKQSRAVIYKCHANSLKGTALPWQQAVTATSEAYCLHKAAEYKEKVEVLETLLKLLTEGTEDEA